METTNIYTLTDPRTNRVRYVGKANNVSQRYKAHLNRARKHQVHKKNWIEQLKREGLKPIIEVIDVVPIEDWIFWETYWISQLRQWGFDLINYTNGGDGCSFANQTSFKKGDKAKKVIGFNKECEIVYEFDSAEDASFSLKTHRSSIPNCANGKSKTIKKIAWFYSENISNFTEYELIENIKNRFENETKPNIGSFVKGQKGIRSKKTVLIDIKTNNRIIFDSGVDIGKFIGVNQSAISWALKNNKIIKKQFKIEKYE
jgi:group I intron endonuclease